MITLFWVLNIKDAYFLLHNCYNIGPQIVVILKAQNDTEAY